ncbi:MAG: PfkB family carbohydrate kinase [Syntrophomonadaceae bacterium]|nr:PfkB family carbohydrate kinase [Syntrophomonadaceae bacterium]MDD3024596.1 PfkB family carbohydrate kinase [Syntrophomonadaceae bacterium]
MRLTSREKEIFEVLKNEPLISQDELSRRFGITRSSVAVHISNLMKKGIILGKGYVFNEEVSIVIIGESYMKISINTESENHTVDVSYGGFGLDAGRVFTNFGVGVKLITVLGNDELGTNILNEIQGKNIETFNIYKHPEKRSCRKVLVNNNLIFEENFNSDEYEKAINAREWVAFNCEWLLVEPQFQEDVCRRAMGKDEEKLPFLCTYYNIDFPEEIPEYLSKYAYLVLGVSDAKNLDLYGEKVNELIKDGSRNCIVTDGSSRLLYYSKQVVTDFPLMPNQNFAGNKGMCALLAGLIYGIASGYPLRQAVRIAIGNASV